jgi:hypothetical protein
MPEAADLPGQGLAALASVVELLRELEKSGHVVVVDVADHHQVDVERRGGAEPALGTDRLQSRPERVAVDAGRAAVDDGELGLRLAAGVEDERIAKPGAERF